MTTTIMTTSITTHVSARAELARKPLINYAVCWLFTVVSGQWPGHAPTTMSTRSINWIPPAVHTQTSDDRQFYRSATMNANQVTVRPMRADTIVLMLMLMLMLGYTVSMSIVALSWFDLLPPLITLQYDEWILIYIAQGCTCSRIWYHNAYTERCTSYSKSVRLSVCLSVRPSVRPSHAGTVSKRLKLRSWGLHCRIAPWL